MLEVTDPQIKHDPSDQLTTDEHIIFEEEQIK